MRLTRHFTQRASQRGLRPDVLEFILAWGSEYRRHGKSYLTVRWSAVPRTLRKTRLLARTLDWVVVFRGDVAITCYRRRYAVHTFECQGAKTVDTGAHHA